MLEKPVTDSKTLPAFSVREPKLIVDVPPVASIKAVDIKYPLLLKLAYAHIEWKSGKKQLVYSVVEPRLTEAEKNKLEAIKTRLAEKIDVSSSVFRDTKQSIDYLKEKLTDIVEDESITFIGNEYRKIMYYIFRDFVGLNEIEPIMHDPNVEDIGCPGIGLPVYIVHRRFGSLETNIYFHDAEYANNFVIKLAEKCGKYVSYALPLLDGSLPDGSRVQASLAKDVTTRGPTFSIRRFRKNPFSPTDLIKMGTSSTKMMAYLWLAIEHGTSMLICGGSSTGKTALLNSISIFIRPEKKVISIEDTREINIPHKNWIPAVTRTGFGLLESGGKRYGEITLFDLLKESFRMKPDYAIVGEIRGEEAYVMFQGMASGHSSLGTMHAASVDDIIKRLTTPPIELSPTLIEALDYVIIMTNAKEKGESARRVKNIFEIQSVDSETSKAHTIKLFYWIPATDEFRDSIQQSEVVRRISFKTGISYNALMKEIDDREKVLSWLYENETFDLFAVASAINLYYKDKDSIMRLVLNKIPIRSTEAKRILEAA
ncbi:MAG: type II/IV secretion system ATPase subunit [Candidatus Aenigmarchaeota archaeon]|nr:type II/IV secretion system ATPase subunit [Candidatus Aenigmarchaeota archaeon]